MMIRRIACAGIVLALSVSGVFAQQTQQAGARRAGGNMAPRVQREARWLSANMSQAEFNALIATVSPTDQQKNKLKKEYEVYQQDIQSFRDDAGEQLHEQSEDNRRQILLTLNTQWEKVVGEHYAAVNAILTKDQRVKWQTVRLNGAIMARLSGITLSSQQTEDMKKLVDAAAETLASLDAKDVKSVAVQQGKVLRDVMMNVLTDEQLSQSFLPTPNPFMMGMSLRGVMGGGENNNDTRGPGGDNPPPGGPQN